MAIADRIEAALKRMRPSEADVARYLLRDPARVASSSLREVAAWCGTSDATVLRTCRRAGFDGYQDLKYHVLRELTAAGGSPRPNKQECSVPVDDMRASVAACLATLPAAAKLLRVSRRVAIVGLGASGGVGCILTDVLATLGKQPLPLSNDLAIEFAFESGASRLVLVAISHSGETGFVLRAVRRAKRARVPTIGITNQPSSALARLVDVLLTTQAVERPEGSFSIVPRLCQLAVLDQLTELLKRPRRSSGTKRNPQRRAAPA